MKPIWNVDNMQNQAKRTSQIATVLGASLGSTAGLSIFIKRKEPRFRTQFENRTPEVPVKSDAVC
jgi:hypothetical protein